MKIRDRFCDVLRYFSLGVVEWSLPLSRGVQVPDGCQPYRPARGEQRFMGALSDLLRCTIEGDHDNWLAYLPKRVAAAVEELRTDAAHERFRAAYADDAGHEIPSLINVHHGGLHRVLVTRSVVRLLPIIAAQASSEGRAMMPWLEASLDSYFHAQDRAVEQAWHGFADRHYMPLMVRIKAEYHRGNKGTFGETELLTWAGMGRVMFQFQRGDESVAAVADDGDPVGYRSGLNAIAIPYERAVAMIRDVTENFDGGMLREDRGVSFAGM